MVFSLNLLHLLRPASTMTSSKTISGPVKVLIASLSVVSCIGGLAGFLKNVTLAYSLILSGSIVILVGYLLHQGIESRQNKRDYANFFWAKDISVDTTAEAIGSLWIMLGSLVIANMFVIQIFGWWSIFVLITWVWSFRVLSSKAEEIQAAITITENTDRKTLHTWLYEKFASRGMRITAALITLTVAVGVFSAELIAGAALMELFIPKEVGDYALPITGGVFVIAMSTAVVFGGLPAVVNANAVLWNFVILALICLGVAACVILESWTFWGVFIACVVVLSVTEFYSDNITITKTLFLSMVPLLIGGIFYCLFDFHASDKFVSAWERTSAPEMGVGFIFMIGVICLQVPLLICDFGMWQRLGVAKKKSNEAVGNGNGDIKGALNRQAIYQLILWFLPMVLGVAALKIDVSGSGQLFELVKPLSAVLQYFRDSGGWLSLLVAPFVIFGLFAVMVTTANSYLLIAIEVWLRDLAPVHLSHDDSAAAGDNDIERAKKLAMIFAVLGCIPAALFVSIQFPLLNIVFVFFGVQVALAPAVVVGLKGDILS